MKRVIVKINQNFKFNASIKNRAMNIIALFFCLICNLAFTRSENANSDRYLWVVRTALTDKKNIDKMIQFATLNRVNNIIVQVRGRGDAYYNSNIVPKSSLIKDREFDPLGYLIPKAKEKGVNIHAWLNTYLLWSSKKMPIQKNHILLTYPNWLDHNSFSQINIEKELSKVGTKKGYEGLYLSPDHPEVNPYLISIFKELFINYKLDGIHLDYIRFHDSDYGKNLFTYSSDQNNDGNPVKLNNQWSNIKRKSITDLVRKTSSLITELGLDIEFSAAVKPNLYTARERFYQEWDIWIAAGYIDKVMIMNYSPDLKIFSDNINIIFKNLPLKYRKKIVMGLATYNQTSDQVVSKIKYARIASMNDFAFFSYNVMSHNPRYFRPIKNELYK